MRTLGLESMHSFFTFYVDRKPNKAWGNAKPMIDPFDTNNIPYSLAVIYRTRKGNKYSRHALISDIDGSHCVFLIEGRGSVGKHE